MSLFFVDAQKGGKKSKKKSFLLTFLLFLRLSSLFSPLSTTKKLATMPALAKAAQKAAVPAGKGKKKQVSCA